MSNNPFYKKCSVVHFSHIGVSQDSCEGRIEWHHNLIYGGKQVNEPFCILPLCQKHHKMADKTDFREFLNWIMVSRATSDDLKRYSKVVDYERIYQNLNRKYGGMT